MGWRVASVISSIITGVGAFEFIIKMMNGTFLGNFVSTFGSGFAANLGLLIILLIVLVAQAFYVDQILEWIKDRSDPRHFFFCAVPFLLASYGAAAEIAIAVTRHGKEDGSFWLWIVMGAFVVAISKNSWPSEYGWSRRKKNLLTYKFSVMSVILGLMIYIKN